MSVFTLSSSGPDKLNVWHTSVAVRSIHQNGISPKVNSAQSQAALAMKASQLVRSPAFLRLIDGGRGRLLI
jgi:hypothetical protein